MSALLFGAGAIAFVAGAVLVGYGIPVHEFSFGNTLILAGVVAMTGGLIVVALGMVVSHLQRLAEAMSRGVPGRAYVEGRVPAASARVPFPPRPKGEHKSDVAIQAPAAIEPISDQRVVSAAPDHVAPTLPNPDESAVPIEDEVSLSPRHPFAPAATPDLDRDLPPPFPSPVEFADRDRAQDDLPAFEAAWRTTAKDLQNNSAVAPEVGTPKVDVPKVPASAPPISAASKAASSPRQPTYFDSMWPSESKETTAETPAEPKSDAKPEPLVAPKFQSAFAPQSYPAPAEPKPELRSPLDQDEGAEQDFGWQNGEPRQTVEPRTVAILKSGVVDGMGYTLYVDGSIEAELPQGTLHFASINELRSHLEKTS